MWLIFFLIFVVTQFLIFAKSRKNVDRKLEKDEVQKAKIIELGWWPIVVELVKALTVYLHTADYEVSTNAAASYGPQFIGRLSRVIPFHHKVLINSIDLATCKKVMSSVKWPDRFPLDHYINKCSFNKPYGLFSGGGQYYKVARQQSIKMLHEFGFFSPTRMEGLVAFEMAEVEAILTKRIEDAGGELTFTPHQMFQVSTINMVWQMMLGTRFSYQDPRVYDLMKVVSKNNRTFNAPYNVMEIIPFIKHFPWLTSLRAWLGCCDYCYKYFKEIIAEKRKEPLEERLLRPPTDLVDGFLKQIDKLGGKDEYLNDEHLMVIMRDMVFAGTDTSTSVLEYGLLYMSLNLDIQRKVEEEIDQIIGHHRAPLYADKMRMTYTHAVLLEVLRLGSTIPGIIRTASEDTEIEGTKAPKDTIFAINFYGIHRSEEIWEDPLEFRPERFLDENQNLINQDKIIPFGYGKRACMGETVGLVTVFIFFVTLLQKFEFQISPDHPPPSFKNVHGLSRAPLPYYLRVRKRVVKD